MQNTKTRKIGCFHAHKQIIHIFSECKVSAALLGVHTECKTLTMSACHLTVMQNFKNKVKNTAG